MPMLNKIQAHDSISVREPDSNKSPAVSERSGMGLWYVLRAILSAMSRISYKYAQSDYRALEGQRKRLYS